MLCQGLGRRHFSNLSTLIGARCRILRFESKSSVLQHYFQIIETWLFNAHIANKITLLAYDADTLGKKGSRFVEMNVTIEQCLF